MALTLLRPSEAALRAGLSRSGLFRLVREGRFPQPIKLSARRTGFADDEVDAWIQAKLDERPIKETTPDV